MLKRKRRIGDANGGPTTYIGASTTIVGTIAGQGAYVFCGNVAVTFDVATKHVCALTRDRPDDCRRRTDVSRRTAVGIADPALPLEHCTPPPNRRHGSRTRARRTGTRSRATEIRRKLANFVVDPL